MRRALVAIIALMIIALPLAAADGAAIYKGKCAMCHGPDGAGQTPAGKSMKVRDLRSPEVQKAVDADLARIIADGKGKMPAYKTQLSAEEIATVVGFIRTLKN